LRALAFVLLSPSDIHTAATLLLAKGDAVRAVRGPTRPH
jgi:hypothetical protein